jgi:hypothetical protein
MNILIIQEAGQHEKNRQFREALNLQRAFNRIDVICNVWGLGYPEFTQEGLNNYISQCDTILLLENYATEWLPDISACTKPKIFWSIDAHCNLLPQLETVEKQNINHVLSSTYSLCNKFVRPGNRYCSWFPNAYPSDLIQSHPDIQKTIDVGFCGNIQNRGQWLELIYKEFGLALHDTILTPGFYKPATLRVDWGSWIREIHRQKGVILPKMVLGEDMVRTICSYKIHWNRNISVDVNCRTFETLGCGTFLMTNDTDRLEDLFTINEHLVTYGSPQECLDKIEYFLKNEKEREEIAQAGCVYVKQWHTYDCRAKQFLDIINSRL